MLKIIRGKRYDTDTAKWMGNDHYSHPGDLSHWTETLYRKQTGEYFLYGEGGPDSKYRTYSGSNSWGGGAKITPFTLEEAKKWAEDHLDGREYEAIFGKVDEAEEKKTVALSLSQQTAEKLKQMAVERRITASELVERLINGTL